MKDHFILGGDWPWALQPKETIQSPTESESALATQPLLLWRTGRAFTGVGGVPPLLCFSRSRVKGEDQCRLPSPNQVTRVKVQSESPATVQKEGVLFS